MELLVLGGTVFLSRAVAEEAAARGHQVVCASRGKSGSVPDGAELVVWDRSEPMPAGLTSRRFDAVVDTARLPSRVQSAVSQLPDAHWIFISTVNVYADDATPHGRPGTLPLHDPQHEDVDLEVDPEAYGPMKVACEQLVSELAASSTLIRPGLISGPGDVSGRFTYWPVRIADGGEMIAPGSPDDLIQVIDVRDLAAWVVDCAEARTAGTFDGVGSTERLGDVLDAMAVAVGPDDVTFTWVPADFLDAQGVQPWMGPDSLPLWLPRPEYDGLMSHDLAPSLEAGLRLRPVGASAVDTLAWVRATPSAAVTGISREREAEVLTAWHASQA